MSRHVAATKANIVLITTPTCQLIRYFTCGPDEVRAWTIRRGTKAPQAAGVIQCVSSLGPLARLYPSSQKPQLGFREQVRLW